ncbi:hypothetical protein U1Q18_046100, partial [Sarracenia purpurea var. burkii]
MADILSRESIKQLGELKKKNITPSVKPCSKIIFNEFFKQFRITGLKAKEPIPPDVLKDEKIVPCHVYLSDIFEEKDFSCLYDKKTTKLCASS